MSGGPSITMLAPMPSLVIDFLRLGFTSCRGNFLPIRSTRFGSFVVLGSFAFLLVTILSTLLVG